jgi:hypothetical protein
MIRPDRRVLATGLALVPVLTCLAQGRAFEKDILAETFGFDQQTRRSVAFDDLHQGCPARDCIPSIDQPGFVAAEQADFLAGDDLVLAIEHRGEARAYPTRILDRHEIVNDVIGGDPVAITWCPLCGSGLAFHRVVAGLSTEFGVSGLLFNSALVFYDRTTETLWDQIEGKGIVGPRTGVELEILPLAVARWQQWLQAHPDTRVLSIDTGFAVDYAQDPYAAYRRSDRIMFPVSGTDGRLGPKSVVFGACVDGHYVAYSERLLELSSPYRDGFADRRLLVTRQPDGAVAFRDLDTGEQFTPVRLFWFAWVSFHPETALRDIS